jgi:hypothetical protein
MSNWLLRGIVFAAGMVVVRLLQGALINTWETKAGLISIVLMVVFVIVAFVWGLADGRSDAKANPDPDRRADLAMTWLLGGLFAGVVSGLVAWLISLFYNGLYVEALVNELTTFAAFTALLVFLFGIAGVAIGHWLIDRNAEEVPRQRMARADREARGDYGDYADRDRGDDRADTDVFAAVGNRQSTDSSETTQPVADYDAEKTTPTTQHGGEKA